MKNYLKKAGTALIAIVFAFGIFSPLTADTASAASQRPHKVTGLKVACVDYDSLKITWSKAKYAKKYKVYKVYKKAYKKKGKTKYKTVSRCIKTTSARSFQVNGLSFNKYYSYKVRAVNGSKVGKYSKTVKAKTTLTRPYLKVKKGLGENELSWNNVGASSYRVIKNGEEVFKGKAFSYKDSVESGESVTYCIIAERAGIRSASSSQAVSSAKFYTAYECSCGEVFTSRKEAENHEDVCGGTLSSSKEALAPVEILSAADQAETEITWKEKKGVKEYTVYKNGTFFETVSTPCVKDDGQDRIGSSYVIEYVAGGQNVTTAEIKPVHTHLWQIKKEEKLVEEYETVSDAAYCSGCDACLLKICAVDNDTSKENRISPNGLPAYIDIEKADAHASAHIQKGENSGSYSKTYVGPTWHFETVTTATCIYCGKIK